MPRISDRIPVAPPPLRLHLFGQFRAEIGTQPVRLPARKVESLLAYLVLHSEPHSREQLAFLLWADVPDTQARHSLRTALNVLRKHLGADLLLTDRETVQLNASFPVWVDAREFQLAAGNRRQLTRDASISVLQSALSLYQGDLLADFYDDWILAERERFHQLYLEALLDLTQQLRSASEYERAIESAQQVLAIDPANERAYQHLMFCHIALGRRDAALQQYDALSDALRSELDVEPAPESTALYQWIRQASLPGTALAAQITNLPIPLSSFVGREREKRILKQFLRTSGPEATPRLVTLTGPGGSGKTRLAIQVAMDLIDGFRDGVWWVDLAPLADESVVAHAVAKALGLDKAPTESLNETLNHFLRAKQLLLVLDNCEHLISTCARLADSLLTRCPNLRIIATSRAALHIAGEQVFAVPALLVPPADRRTLAQLLLEFDSVKLFVERARGVQSDFVFDDAAALSIVQICQRLDGIPLAIELAAARVNSLSAQEISSRLDDRFKLLTQGSRTALPRQQTLRATIDWGYALLPAEEQALLRKLAVFAGGFSAEASGAVAASDRITDHSTLTLLSHLVDKSLVIVDRQYGASRYHLLEMTKEYAADRLEEAQEAEGVRTAHLDFFYRLVQEMEPKLRSMEQREAVHWFEREHDNLRVALAWSLASGKSETGLHLAILVGTYWKLQGYLGEGSNWLAQALSASGNVSKGTRSRALILLADLASQAGNHEQASIFSEQGLRFGREFGDQLVVASALVVAGAVAHRRGDREAAVGLLEEGLALFRETGAAGRWGTAEALLRLGDVRMRQGDLERAGPLCEESLTMFRELGDRWGIAFSLGNSGELARRQDEPEKAAALLGEALEIHWELGDQGDIPYSLEALAIVATNQGQFERAAHLWGAAENLRDAISARVPVMYENDYAYFIRHARARVGESSWNKMWAEGRAMTLQQAVEYALKPMRETTPFESTAERYGRSRRMEDI